MVCAFPSAPRLSCNSSLRPFVGDPVCHVPRAAWLAFDSIHDGFRKRLGSFLRQIVPNTTLDVPVRVFA